TRQLKAGSPPSLLPFDTLLLPYPVNPAVAQGDGGEPTKERSRRRDAETRDRRGLHIGFVGHDFAEHPTAHMMEGVFV
ncbi:unnamed protein product, partial [Scytosiphon promiscuus]